MINYISLMLINLVAGHFLLAYYIYDGLDNIRQKRWIPGFGMTGAVALVTGLHMIFTWPITGSFNVAFGEMSVLFGIVFMGASVALAANWDLITVTIYAFFAGLASIVVGVQIINLDLTRRPWMSGIGFIISGLGGVLATPSLYLRNNPTLRTVGAVTIAIAGLIWAITGYLSYWGHIADYTEWVPPTMR
ncbi:MAG: DUF981 domain-containing protein [Chroococcales cyanobacterium]